MKKVVDVRTMYRVNGKEWVDTNIWKNYAYLEETDCEDWEKLTTDFDKVLEWAKKDLFDGAVTVETGFFSKEEKLHYLIENEYLIGNLTSTCTRKRFKTFEVKVVYKPVNPNIETLKTNLSAESFCEYLRDRGLEKIIL